MKVRCLLLTLLLALSMPMFGQSASPTVTTTASFAVERNVAAQPVSFTLDNWVTVEHRNADGVLLEKFRKHNITTNAGKDFIKAQVSGTGTTANCKYIAVGNSVVNPGATDTTLTGEVTTNGLGRVAGTYTAGSTGAFTLSNIFTASGAVADVQSAAVFTAASSGTMCFEVGSLGPVTLATNDTLTVTWSGQIN